MIQKRLAQIRGVSVGFTGRMPDQNTIDMLERTANDKARSLTVYDVWRQMPNVPNVSAETPDEMVAMSIDMAIAMACEPNELPDNAHCEVYYRE